MLLTQVGPMVPEGAVLRPVYDHWVLAPLGALALACLFTGFDYWSAARSLDKLRPEHSRLALEAIDTLRNELSEATVPRRDELLREFTQQATLALKQRPPAGTNAAEWLKGKPAAQSLSILLNANLQRRLSLLEPNLYVISLFQVALTVGVGITLMFVAFVAFFTHTQMGPALGATGALARVLNLCSLGVVAFGLYAICYQQYRSQLSEFVGAYSSTTPHYVVAAAVIAVLLTLSLVVPEKSSSPIAIAARYSPLIALGSLTVIERTQQSAVRALIGMDTNLGTQAMVAMALGTFFSCLFAYSWFSLR